MLRVKFARNLQDLLVASVHWNLWHSNLMSQVSRVYLQDKFVSLMRFVWHFWDLFKQTKSVIWQWTCLPPMKMRKLLPFLCQTKSFENHERCTFNTNFSLCFTASENFFLHAYWYFYKSLWVHLASLVSFLFFHCKFWSPGMVTWINCRMEVFVKERLLAHINH